MDWGYYRDTKVLLRCHPPIIPPLQLHKVPNQRRSRQPFRHHLPQAISPRPEPAGPGHHQALHNDRQDLLGRERHAPRQADPEHRRRDLHRPEPLLPLRADCTHPAGRVAPPVTAAEIPIATFAETAVHNHLQQRQAGEYEPLVRSTAVVQHGECIYTGQERQHRHPQEI